jgi:GPH family glycoside/pentoside/hexuronide:cation symporter
MLAKTFQFLSFSSTATTSLLFMLNVLHIGYGGQIQLAITQNIAGAVSMPAWLWLERLMGKRNAYMVGILLMCLTSASWLLIGPGGIGLFSLILRGVAGGVGSGGMILLSMSMLSDTLAYDRDLTGEQREGLLSSVTAVIEKTSFALGVAVIGVFLSLAHYMPTKNGALVQQSHTTITALYVSFALAPIALFICNAVCIGFYTIGGRDPTFRITTIDAEPAAT